MTVWTGSLIAASAGRWAMGLLMAAALVGIPHRGEVWATPTNLQCIMASGLPVVLLMPTPASFQVRAQQVAFVQSKPSPNSRGGLVTAVTRACR